jgi:aspartate/methionine/tyrosine aminotransferase
MIGNLPEFRLETWFSRWEFAAAHSFTASDAQTMTVRELLTLAGRDLDEITGIDLGYRPTFGTNELRQAVAELYDTLDAADVLTFTGAQEALFWLIAELLSEGGHAVVTVPNYQSIESIPLATTAAVSGLPMWTGSGTGLRWTLDLDRLETVLRPDTRVVVVNFPNNPTGYVPDRDIFTALARLCHGRGIVLVCDEVYRGIEVDPGRTLPHAADLTPSAVSVNVMSKSYGLPGLRVGWVATHDRNLLGRLEHRKHYTSICNPGVTEYLATIALGVGELIHDRNRAIVRANIDLVRGFFADYPDLFEFEAPLGGCVSFPRYLGADGPDVFARKAVEQAGVLTLPASIYESELADVPRDRIRIGFGRTGLPQTLDALHAHLATGSGGAS